MGMNERKSKIKKKKFLVKSDVLNRESIFDILPKILLNLNDQHDYLKQLLILLINGVKSRVQHSKIKVIISDPTDLIKFFFTDVMSYLLDIGWVIKSYKLTRKVKYVIQQIKVKLKSRLFHHIYILVFTYFIITLICVKLALKWLLA